MRYFVAIVVAIVISACSSGRPATVNQVATTLNNSGAEQLMLRADDLRRLALDAPHTVRLADAFRGRALQVLEAQAETMGGRGLRLEERNSARRLVFWDERAGEAVIQVVAESRLVTPDQPNPTWDATVRQWWARLQYADSSWWVVDQQDLPPDRWWRVAPTA